MEKMDKNSKPYVSGEYDEIFNASEVGNLVNDEAVAYSRSYYSMIDHQHAVEYAREKGMEKGMEKGIKKGMEKGILIGHDERSRQIARNLLKSNVPIDVISQSTGLSETEINKL